MVRSLRPARLLDRDERRDGHGNASGTISRYVRHMNTYPAGGMNRMMRLRKVGSLGPDHMGRMNGDGYRWLIVIGRGPGSLLRDHIFLIFARFILLFVDRRAGPTKHGY